MKLAATVGLGVPRIRNAKLLPLDSSCKDIQRLPEPLNPPRVETGAVQFGDDWPGLFIRGDNAVVLAFKIKNLTNLLADHPNVIVADALHVLTQYANLIEENVRCGS